MDALFHDSIINPNRIIYTPSTFARTSLIHLQETGTLTAKDPHTSSRKNLTSFLFFVVLSGSGTLEYSGNKYNLSVGDCVFINCVKPYSHRTSDDLWTIKWVHFFGPSLVSIYSKYAERGGQPVFKPSDLSGFLHLLEEINIMASSSDYIRDMRINELLSRLLTLLMEQSWQPAGTLQLSSKKQDLQQVREYLDNHLTERITLDDLSVRFFINKYYLSRTFREQFGIPINAYISQQRVTSAKQLLRYSDMTIEQIASQCGVDDPNYFSRMFKKFEGISPAEYRKSWQSTAQNQ